MNRNSVADEELMARYRDGDAGAFEVLYNRHRGGLYRYLLRSSGSAATAEELFQDVWMNLVRARASYAATAKFTTYLYRLAHNRLIDHYRRRPQGVPVSFEDDCPELVTLALDPSGQPDARYDTKQKVERLLALLAELPEAQREAFLLREEAGLSVEDVAQATGVNPETAKSRLRYALAKLRSGMRGYL